MIRKPIPIIVLLALFSHAGSYFFASSASSASAPRLNIVRDMPDNQASMPQPSVKKDPSNNTPINDMLRFEKKSVDEKLAEMLADFKRAQPATIRQLPQSTKYLYSLGVLDVAGGLFAIDSSGVEDSTDEIQRAIDYARDNQMLCYFPAGKYRISRPLRLIQRRYMRANGSIQGAQFFPCAIIGSGTGERSTFLVSKNSFPDNTRQKAVFDFRAENFSKPELHSWGDEYNQILINIDIEIEPGNPSAIAVRQAGSQGCLIQGVNIASKDAFCGLIGGTSAGGGVRDLTVTGGKHGIIINESVAAPSLANITLKNQTNTPLFYSGLNTLTIVGGIFEMSHNGPAILSTKRQYPHTGTLSLIDSAISYPANKDGLGAGIQINTLLYLRNVFFINSAIPDYNVTNAQKGKWLSVTELAKSQSSMTYKGYTYTYPIIMAEDEKNKAAVHTGGFYMQAVNEFSQRPSDMQAQHRFGSADMAFERPESINVKSLGAAGDGLADDTAVIQKALDEYDDVFIPKGIFRITNPLKMKPGNTLSGVGKHLSLLFADTNFPAFNNSYAANPLLSTAGPESTNHIAHIGLYVPRPAPGAYALLWQCGPKSTKTSTNIITWPPIARYTENRKHPQVVIDGGSGKWDAYFGTDVFFHDHPYRHMAIKNSHAGLSIYQLNLEHARTVANMEIADSSNISMYSLKAEANYPLIRISNSNNIALYGYGGHAAALAGTSLFYISNSSDIRFVTLVDNPYLPGRGTKDHYAGMGIDPTEWSMIHTDNPDYTVKNSERPVLFWQKNAKAQ